MKFIKSFLLAILISLLVSLTLVGIFFRKAESVSLDKNLLSFSTNPTVIYYSDNKPLAKFYNDRRSLTTYEETPKEIIDSIVSTEDRTFYNHPGISIKGITRAAVEIVKAKGEIVQGGSTITQQLAKNTYLTSSPKIERKINEIIYAFIIEKEYSKEQILEMYMNDVEFAWKSFGLKDALMTYFGLSYEQFNKKPKEERIAISSVLTAMLKSPTYYDPYKKPENALKRRNEVIYNMYSDGKITEAEMIKSMDKPLLILEKPKVVFEEEKIDNEELVTHALKEASNKLDISIRDVMSGGYAIHTSFNRDIYDLIRKTYRNNNNFPSNAKDGTKVQSASVFINPKNGEIIAFTGGREEPSNADFLGYNRAYMLKKQPGSTLKPVVAYGPALESGKFTSYSSLLDEKGHVFPGGYVVKDWDKSGRGSVTMKEALRQSWNIPAVYALQETGLNYAKTYVKKLGINLDEEKTLGIALGGLVGGVSPLEMGDAYQAFANEGIRTPAHSVRYIKSGNNTLIYKTTVSKTQTIDAQNARDMKDMLRQTVSNGVSSKGAIPGRKIAGKTGTVQHPFIKGSVNADAWFVGFDENIVGVTWMGYDKISKDRYLNVNGGYVAQFWSRLTSKILDYYEANGGLETPKDLNITPSPDDKAPNLTLNGQQELVLEFGEKYKEPGAIATDNIDGDLTDKIKILGEVNSQKAGTYLITYKVSDTYGNTSQLTRTILVKELQRPVVEMDINTEPYNNGLALYVSWDSVSDNVIYQLYKNDELIQELNQSYYIDSSVITGENATYYVVAIYKDTGDKAGETGIITAELPSAFDSIDNETIDTPE